MEKRIRTTNFTRDEKMGLLSIVSKYKHVIENKKTDAVSATKKKSTWTVIATEFNSSLPGGIPRSAESLRKCYLNMKKDIKKQVATDKKQIYVTGGGKKENEQPEPQTDLMLSIINEKTVYGLYNPYDGDRTETITILCEDENYENNDNQQELLRDDPDETFTKSMDVKRKSILINDDENSEQICSDISEVPLEPVAQELNNVTQSNTPQHKPNIRRRRPPAVKALTTSLVAQRYNLLITRRLEIADYQLKCLKVDLKHKEEKHALEIELLKKDLEIKHKALK